jgi:2-phosphoglycerate kinase
VLDRATFPELWAESFDVPMAAGDERAAGRTADGSPVNLAGFERQCAPVLACVEAGVEYALAEGWNCVVEGVHLVPGSFAVAGGDDVRVRVELCEPAGRDVHADMFLARDLASSGRRPVSHYLANLPRIEVVAAMLRERWHAWELPDGVEREVVVAGGGD